MARNRKFLSALGLIGIGLAIGLTLSGCGLGRNSDAPDSIDDPVVAATVNGRPIYIEDVRAHAVARGLMQEGEDVDANSEAFYQALEELIERRLFSMEAEARGLDRRPEVRRQVELARETVLWSAIADEILASATDPEQIEQLYRENLRRLGRGEQVQLRHIQFATREAADAAKRRLDQGERFEALAFELSTDRETAPDGGLVGWGDIGDLTPAFREASDGLNVGVVSAPFQQDGRWHLLRIDDRRAEDAESLEALRPAIIRWLIYRETMELRERLEENARIERLRVPEAGMEPGGEVTAPADAEPDEPLRPAPETPAPDAPPFPFPMGPGGVTGTPAPAAPAAETPAPRPTAPPPAPAPTPDTSLDEPVQ